MATDDIGFLQEIDESLRADKFHYFWQRFGNLLIAGCAGIILVTIASVAWKNHVHDVNMHETAILLKGQNLLGKGQYKEAALTFEKAEDGNGGLATLARLLHASALLNDAQTEKALALYKTIAENSNDEGLRNLAAMQVTVITSNQAQGTKKDAASLHQASDSSLPFHALTNELIALRMASAGNAKEARALLSSIAEDTSLPGSERTRAMEILDTLGEDRK